MRTDRAKERSVRMRKRTTPARKTNRQILQKAARDRQILQKAARDLQILRKAARDLQILRKAARSRQRILLTRTRATPQSMRKRSRRKD